MNRLLTVALLVALALFAASVFGPRESVDWTIWISADDLGEDLDAYLTQAEGRIQGIRPGTEKRIVWAGEQGKATPLSVVYLHGFSATHHEIAPTPQRIAEALGANLYLARLTGHGRDGAALAGATANDWINDTAEALEIAARLGDRTVIVATSTGATLAIALAAYPEYRRQIAGLILVSPNLELAQPGAWLLVKPFARWFVPWVTGREISWEPISEDHAKWWTPTFPVEAVFQMAALVYEVRAIDPADLTVPALFVISPADRVVKPAVTRDIAARWGGPADVWEIAPGQGIDTMAHVLAGDILSPAMTTPLVERALDWIGGLP